MTKSQADDKDNSSKACGMLRDLWRNGDVCEGLPDGLKPASKKEAYRIQSHIETSSANPLVAWKIAATSQAGQKHIGVSGPLAGRYIAEQCVEPGASIPFGNNRMRVAEVEFAFRFAHDFAPRNRPYSEDEIIAGIASLHPSIEIPDSRYRAFERAGEFQLIADNACAHILCLGPAMPDIWRSLDLADYKPHGIVKGKPAVEGQGRNVLGSPRIALGWFVNEMTSLGMTLRQGQYVSTGTCLIPLPIAPGDHVTADFGDLGRISVTLGPT